MGLESRFGKIQKHETNKQVKNQLVLVKTAGAPDLLARSLRAIRVNIHTTSSSSEVHIGVMDDSADTKSRGKNRKAIQDSGLHAAYLSTKEIEHNDLLTRIKRQAYEKTRYKYGISQEEFSNAFQFLLTEQLNLDNPTIHADGTVGYGAVSTVNSSALLGSYIMGRQGLNPDESIFTQYDDDVIHGHTITKAHGNIELVPFDAFAQRDEAFASPKTEISAGKYVGIVGNPLTSAIHMLDAANAILDEYQTSDPKSQSSYVLYNPLMNELTPATVEEAYKKLPEIIDSFIGRAPLTGFFSQEDFQASPQDQLRFDGGNYSMRANLRRILPTPPTGMEEHIIFAAVDSLRPGVTKRELLVQETPAAHLRIPHKGERIYPAGILAGTHSARVRHQILIKALFAQNTGGIRKEAEQAFNTTIDFDRPDFMPQLQYANRLPAIQKVIELTGELAYKIGSIAQNDPQLAVKLAIFLEAFSGEQLSFIKSTLEPPSVGSSEIIKTLVGTRKFLTYTAKYWPEMFDAAYELGQLDAQTI